jgi:hypothetical protein
MTTAVVFVPYTDSVQYASQCLTYCAIKGYDVAGVVTGNWPAVAAMLLDGIAGVVVVARPEHVDPQRQPRLEVAVLDRPNAAPRAARRAALGQRRAHRV